MSNGSIMLGQVNMEHNMNLTFQKYVKLWRTVLNTSPTKLTMKN